MYENSKYHLPYLQMNSSQDSQNKSRKLKIEDLSTSENDFHKLIDENQFSNSDQQQSIKFLMENIEQCNSEIVREQQERKLINILNIKDDKKDNINENKCAEHQDEDLLFVCYNCSMKSLCIECISIGCQHNGHEIKNVKKARADVQLLLNQNLLKLKRKIESIGQEHDKLLLKKSEFVELNQSLKKSLHIQFQEIRDLLNQKEKELLNNINTVFNNKQKSLNNQSTKIKNKMKIFIESHKVIEETIKQLNDQKLCQYYYKKQKDLQQLVQDPLDYIQTDRILDDLLTFKQQFQTETLKNIIDNFTNLHEELNGIKGIETIQTQYMITESPEPSKISTTDTPRNQKSNENKFNLNQTQKSEILKDSFFQKIDETVFSVQTNGSNLKDPNNFLFSNIFKKQKESQIFCQPFQKSYDLNKTLNNDQQNDNILSSKVISQFIQETQKSKLNKENQAHRSKSITIFQFDEKQSKQSNKDSLCYSQSGIQQSFCQKQLNFQTYESNNILEKSNSSQLSSQISNQIKYHQSKQNKNQSMNPTNIISNMSKKEEQNRYNQQGQLKRQQSLFSNISAKQKTSFL